jgi:NTP pyrophosphatase (non-canonical NTP hydrolase)
MENKKIDLDKYTDFVAEVTSQESNDLTTFINSLDRVDANYETFDGPDNPARHGPDINVPLLLTAALGLAAETGEFCEIPKKIFFQRKPLSEEALFHMQRELGDVMWYWINACRALNLDPNAVIAENIKKLESRYPGGKFDAYHSENRKDGDL